MIYDRFEFPPCMYRKHVYLANGYSFPQILFAIDTFMTMDRRGLRARLNETLCKHQGLLVNRPSRELPPPFRARAN